MTDTFLDQIRSYVKPRSLTWWACIIAIFSGLLRATGNEIPVVSVLARPVIDALFLTSDPGSLVLMGLAGIGFRGKLDRMRDGLTDVINQ